MSLKAGEYLPVSENERGTYIFNSKDLNQEVTFNLGMKKLEDGTWQAIKVNNFKEYFELVEKNEKNKTNKN